MATPQLLLPTDADELWNGPISSLVFTQQNPGASTLFAPISFASNGEGLWVGTYGFPSNAEPWVAYSTDDGATWAAVDTGLGLFGTPTWDGDRFVMPVTGAGSSVAVSEDGATWSTVAIAIGTVPIYLVFVPGAGRWVAGDGSTPKRLYISDDYHVEGPWSGMVHNWGSISQPLRETDGVDLVTWRNDTGFNINWMEVASTTEGTGVLTGSGHPTWHRFGPLGGDWFAGSSIAGDYWTSADGKNWTSATEAALGGMFPGDAYWDGTVWWVIANDGVTPHLFEFDPSGPSWTDHTDLPDVGEFAQAIAGTPLVTVRRLEVLDTIAQQLALSPFLEVLDTWAQPLQLTPGLDVLDAVAQPLQLTQMLEGAERRRTPGSMVVPVSRGTEEPETPAERRALAKNPPDPTGPLVPAEPWIRGPGQFREPAEVEE